MPRPPHINFYPRSPCGERLPVDGTFFHQADFYPRSPCGERLWPGLLARPFFLISIHALLAESDYLVRGQRPNWRISIHALLAESDPDRVSETLVPRQFLSTLSLRRATTPLCHTISFSADFYPRSPCGERQHAYQLVLWVLRFLSTLSLRRATISRIKVCIDNADFYPRSPCGERLFLLRKITITVDISIHALLAESDVFFLFLVYFICIFLSTLSLRRATRRSFIQSS